MSLADAAQESPGGALRRARHLRAPRAQALRPRHRRHAQPGQAAGRRHDARRRRPAARARRELAELVRWADEHAHPADAARQGLVRLRRRHPGQERHGRRLLPDEERPRGRRRRPDRHRRARHHLGAAGPRAQEAGPDPAHSTRPAIPRSTVGGWLAQGGAGIGSYEFGCFGENVRQRPRRAARAARSASSAATTSTWSPTPRASPASSAEVTLKVQDASRNSASSPIACPDAHDLPRLFERMHRGRPARLVGHLHQPAHGGDEEPRARSWSTTATRPRTRVILPAAYIVTPGLSPRPTGTRSCRAPELLKPCQGRDPARSAIAEHEWENRFKLMIVKRLGPSLVPAEVVVPLDEARRRHGARSSTRSTSRSSRKASSSGTAANGKPEAVILGFIPQRPAQVQLQLRLRPGADRSSRSPRSTAAAPTPPASISPARPTTILGAERVERLQAVQEAGRPEAAS